MGLEEGSDQELRGPSLRLLRPIFDRGGVPTLCGDDGTRAEVAGQGRRFALPRECPQLKIEIWGTRFCGFDQRWGDPAQGGKMAVNHLEGFECH
jgi:hypothetical protein